MLKVEKIERLKEFGFNYYVTTKNGRMVDERYVYENGKIVYAEVANYPYLKIKNYACNQEFVEKVFPKMIEAGVVRYLEGDE